MHYYVDGYNFFFKVIQQINPLRKKRDELVAKLNRDIDTARLNVTVIFDSNHVQSLEFPSKYQLDSIEVIFSPAHQTADAYIIELISFQKNPKTETIVTCDRLLTREVKSLGAYTLSVEDFLELLDKKKKKAALKNSKIKEEEMTSWDFERLLKIFHDKLDQSDHDHS